MKTIVITFYSFMAILSALCRWLHDAPGYWEAAVDLEVSEGRDRADAHLRVGWRRALHAFNAFLYAGMAAWLA